MGHSVGRYPRFIKAQNPEEVGKWYMNQAKEEERKRNVLKAEEIQRMSNEVIKRLMREEERNGIMCPESYRQLIREEERRRFRYMKMKDERVNEERARASSGQGNANSLRRTPASGVPSPRGLNRFMGMEGEENLMREAEDTRMTRQEHLERLRLMGEEKKKETSESISRMRRRRF